MRSPSIRLALGAVCLAALAAAPGAGAQTMKQIQDRDELVCGVSGLLTGFSAPDDDGLMQGMDADFCRGLAAAILGDQDKVRFVNLTAKERFEALASGEIDLLARNSTHTLTRDASLGLNFTYYNFIDGQGFMVFEDLDVNSVLQLDGARICVQSGTTTESNLADYFRKNGLEYEQITYDNMAEATRGFENNYCDAITTDASGLASVRTDLANPARAMILPEIISKEPLGPVVRQGDDEFLNVVKWALYAMINAEELGVTQANVDRHRADADAKPAIKRLVGTEGGMCRLLSLRLREDCFHRFIKAVGNYGESYERHVGENTLLRLRRDGSPNQLWSKGGILYAPPLR